MMRKNPPTLRTLALLAVAILAAAAFAQGSADAQGGMITPANLTFEQPLEKWYFFYSSANATANSTIKFTDSEYGAGGNFRQISLPSTSGYYLISDASDPFGDNLTAANLSEFDTHFNLSSTESAQTLFNDTSSFSSQAGVDTPELSLQLPTLYIEGANSAQAFRVGLAQAGENFVFVVPQASAIGKDGQAYDYQFFLPYSNDSMTFYAFSIVPAAASTTTTTTDAVIKPSIDYQWTYDGKTIQITTLGDVSISLVDAIGKTYNTNSGSAGSASIVVYGGKYVLRLSKSGYRDVSDTIYLPEPTPSRSESSVERSSDEKAEVTVERSLQGVTVCVGDACYFSDMANSETAQMLTDLTCTGSLCELVNITPSAFITKHQLRRVGVAGVSAAQKPIVLNIATQIDALGKDLSARLGGKQSTQTSSIELAAIVIGLLAAGLTVFWVSKAWAEGKTRPRGGYG